MGVSGLILCCFNLDRVLGISFPYMYNDEANRKSAINSTSVLVTVASLHSFTFHWCDIKQELFHFPCMFYLHGHGHFHYLLLHVTTVARRHMKKSLKLHPLVSHHQLQMAEIGLRTRNIRSKGVRFISFSFDIKFNRSVFETSSVCSQGNKMELWHTVPPFVPLLFSVNFSE